MPLGPLLREVARLALSLPEADGFVLAGGGAMLEHELVTRGTEDIDLFTRHANDLQRLADAVVPALQARTHAVSVTRSATTFLRLECRGPNGEPYSIDLAQDARMRPAVRLEIGSVLAVEEVAADKVLALFGRGQARDLVDVDALRSRFSDAELLRLAREKDRGFDVGVFARGLRAASQRDPAEFISTGVPAADVGSLRDRGMAWAAELGHRPRP